MVPCGQGLGVVCGAGGRLILAAERILVVRTVVVSSLGEVGVAGWYLQVGVARCLLCVMLVGTSGESRYVKNQT